MTRYSSVSPDDSVAVDTRPIGSIVTAVSLTMPRQLGEERVRVLAAAAARHSPCASGGMTFVLPLRARR